MGAADEGKLDPPGADWMRRHACTVATRLLPSCGEQAWCKMMSDKPKGDWSANEAVDYAKHCLFD